MNVEDINVTSISITVSRDQKRFKSIGAVMG
jgi:hypothetical protein